MVKCPKCGNEITLFDCFSTDSDSLNYYEYWVGECEHCETEIQVKFTYELIEQEIID